MNEPQVWTLIGAFIGGQAALIALVLRVVSTEISGVRRELSGEIAGLRTEMNVRFEHLDRDIQALTKHVFGDR